MTLAEDIELMSELKNFLIEVANRLIMLDGLKETAQKLIDKIKKWEMS